MPEVYANDLPPIPAYEIPEIQDDDPNHRYHTIRDDHQGSARPFVIKALAAGAVTLGIVLTILVVGLGVYFGLFRAKPTVTPPGKFCTSNPCVNGGTCSHRPDGYNCTCPAALGGSHCEIVKPTVTPPGELCASNPCVNGGTCSHRPDGYNCTCPAALGGSHCEIDVCGSSPCQHGGVCQSQTSGYTCSCPTGYTGAHCQQRADCNQYHQEGVRVDGVYIIAPVDSAPFPVYCELHSDTPWTYFQRRVDGSVDFYRGWAEYKVGFGYLTGEHWLGCDNIANLTNQGPYRLRVDGILLDGTVRWAEYSFFYIMDEAKYYQLRLGDLTGDNATVKKKNN